MENTQTFLGASEVAQLVKEYEDSVKGGQLADSPGLAQAAAWYAEGVGVAEIGRRLGIGGAAARRVLVEAGVTSRPHGLPSQLENHMSEVVALRHQGWSYPKIAARFGVGASTVRAFLNRRRATA